MTQLDVAQELEQQILGDRVAFPCGCVLVRGAGYPGKDWVYTNVATHSCDGHPTTITVRRLPNGGLYASTKPVPVGSFKPSKPRTLKMYELVGVGRETEYINEFEFGHSSNTLEYRWLKPDGEQVTLLELDQAMDEALDKIDRDEEQLCEGIGGEHPRWPKRVPRVDSHIVSKDGKFAIGRHGSVSAIPGPGSSVWQYMHGLDRGFMPGEFIDLRKLAADRSKAKQMSFAAAYGSQDPVYLFDRSSSHSYAQAQVMLEIFRKTYPALQRIGRPIPPPPTLVVDEATRIFRDTPINVSDSFHKRTAELILSIQNEAKGLVDTEFRIIKRRDNPGPRYATLPSTIFDPVPKEGDKRCETIVMESLLGAVRCNKEKSNGDGGSR